MPSAIAGGFFLINFVNLCCRVDDIFKHLKPNLRGAVRPCFLRIRMTLDKQRMHPDRRRGFGELEGAVRSSARLFSRSWELCRVGDIEAHRW